VPTAVHKRALRRAIDLAGGTEPLATYLKVSPTAVKFWLNASSPLPDDMFLKIVDLLVERSLIELKPAPGESAPPAGTSGRGAAES
jgi:hypothetical protein